MKKRKTNVDREHLSSDFIKSKQDFGTVLNQVKLLQKPVWKSAWFYGPVGLAVVAVVASAATFNPASQAPLEVSDFTVKPDSQFGIKPADSEVFRTSDKLEFEVKTKASEIDSRSHEVVRDVPVSPVEKVEYPQVEEEKVLNTIESAEVAHESIRKKSKFPHVNHVFTGEITIEDLREHPIESDVVERITEFTIHYAASNGNETLKVSGDRIPEHICASIQKNGIGYMLFITEIKGINDAGELISLPSLNMIPIE